jgi:hypothetical protein
VSLQGAAFTNAFGGNGVSFFQPHRLQSFSCLRQWALRLSQMYEVAAHCLWLDPPTLSGAGLPDKKAAARGAMAHFCGERSEKVRPHRLKKVFSGQY